MVFDAPGAIDNTANVLFAFSLLSFPPLCLASILLSKKALKEERFANACQWACVPLASLAVGAAAVAWICMYQGGKFAG